MRHLIKIAALVFALFSLASCSRTPGSSYSDDEVPAPASFEGGFGIYIKTFRVNPSHGHPYYTYKLDGIYKDFTIRMLSDEKIYRVDYVVELDYNYDGDVRDRHVLKVATDWLTPSQSIITVNSQKMGMDDFIIEGTGVPVKSFHNGAVTVQILTTSGNTYRKTIYNVPIQIYY